jgi:SAM-dependent methyltransferase
MAFNPNQLLNNPATLLALRGAQGQKKEERRGAPAPEGIPAPPEHDKTLYRDAFSRLGLLHIANVADLGCGCGNFTGVMADKRQKFEVYIGVDQSHTQIQIARQAYPGWRFVYGDFSSPKVREEYERYEAYLLLNVLDTMEDDLAFLEAVPSGKKLVFNFQGRPAEGSLRHFANQYELRSRYSGLLSIKSIGTCRQKSGPCGMVVAARW